MNFKVIPILFTIFLVSISGIPLQSAFADAVSGELFYTRFSGTPNVKSVDFSYDGAATFTLSNIQSIGTTPGADGIAGNPQNSDLLIVAGQGPDMSTISKTTSIVSTVASPVSAFHVEVPQSNVVLTSGIPGTMARHAIAPSGALSAGVGIPIVGSTSVLTQVIHTPSGFFYTSSGPGGFGSYGSLTFDTGDPATATLATTSQIHASLAAAHGGTYDPFTNNVIIMGDDEITQLDLAGAIVSTRSFPLSSQFDQGTVDGAGHLFAARNSGDLLFMDYSVSGLVGDVTNFVSVQFLDSNLDDVAPLIGMGSTDPCDLQPSLPECNEIIGGEIMPLNTVSLLVAGLQSMTIWMTPVLAGAVGATAFYLKSRKN